MLTSFHGLNMFSPMGSAGSATKGTTDENVNLQLVDFGLFNKVRLTGQIEMMIEVTRCHCILLEMLKKS